MMAIRIREIEPAPAIVMADLSPPAAHRVGPVVEPARRDAAEDGVEFGLVDQEGVMLRLDRAFGIREIERNAVVQIDDVEMAEPCGRGPAQYIGQEPGGNALNSSTRRWCD